MFFNFSETVTETEIVNLLKWRTLIYMQIQDWLTEPATTENID